MTRPGDARNVRRGNAREGVTIDDETNDDTGVHVDLRPVDAAGFAAVVRLCGEHDLATSDELRAALAPIHGNVLVDLSACEFIDSTAISILIVSQQERAREGQRLELLVPPENSQVTRTLKVAGVGRLLTVHSSRP